MEMSIDEAERYLRALKMCETCEEGDIGKCKLCSCYRIGSSAKCYDAIDVGVDIMRKYQKIEQIVAHYRENVRDKVTNENMEKILEVIEDGRN